MRSTRDFLTGIITGVVIGLLTAPRSGKETREKLTEEANKRTGDLKDQWEKGVSQVKEGYDQAVSQVNQYTDKAKEQFNQYKDQAQATFNKAQVKSDYNDKVEELADDAKSGIDTAKSSLKAS